MGRAELVSRNCSSATFKGAINLKNVKLEVALFILPLATLYLFARTPSHSNVDPSDETLTANPVFHKHCAKCHGKAAAGRHFGGPSLISDKTTATPADDLRNIITNGKGRMPKSSTKLTPEEIDTLVEQIKALSKK
jgi:mono/diheme cytochrome c family protein